MLRGRSLAGVVREVDTLNDKHPDLTFISSLRRMAPKVKDRYASAFRLTPGSLGDRRLRLDFTRMQGIEQDSMFLGAPLASGGGSVNCVLRLPSS